MTRRGVLLFALMSVLWGIPYLLIKVAVRHLSPAVVVEARTLIGAVILLPLAVRQGRIRPVLQRWRPVLAYTVAELAVPWILLSTAEERLASSLSGLLVATVPIIAVALSALSGGHEGRVERSEVLGLLVGLGGVGILLGLDVNGGELGSVGEVLLVAVGYATGPLIVARYLRDLSSLALAAVSLAVAALAYAPVAVVERPSQFPPATGVASVAVLGVLCTALAFVAFFELIREITATRATVITYFNPLVAVLLGVVALGETFRASMALGFALILAGSWLSTVSRRHQQEPVDT